MKTPLKQMYGKYQVWFSINELPYFFGLTNTFSTTGVERLRYIKGYNSGLVSGYTSYGNKYTRMGSIKGVAEYEMIKLLKGKSNDPYK